MQQSTFTFDLTKQVPIFTPSYKQEQHTVVSSASANLRFLEQNANPQILQLPWKQKQQESVGSAALNAKANDFTASFKMTDAHQFPFAGDNEPFDFIRPYIMGKSQQSRIVPPSQLMPWQKVTRQRCGGRHQKGGAPGGLDLHPKQVQKKSMLKLLELSMGEISTQIIEDEKHAEYLKRKAAAKKFKGRTEAVEEQDSDENYITDDKVQGISLL